MAVPAAVLVTAGLGLGLGDGDFAGGLAITTTILPGIWVMAGIALAAFGLFRRAGTVVGWTALALAIAIEVGWEVGLVNDSFFLISPFAHVHYSADFGLGTLSGLTLVAAGLVAVGLTGSAAAIWPCDPSGPGSLRPALHPPRAAARRLAEWAPPPTPTMPRQAASPRSRRRPMSSRTCRTG